MADPYCPGSHPDGWLCILTAGHAGPHLSLDNRSRWRGTVGRPVRWRTLTRNLPVPDAGPVLDATDGDQPGEGPPPSGQTYGDAVVAAIRERTGGALPVHDPAPALPLPLQPHQTPPTEAERAALGLDTPPAEAPAEPALPGAGLALPGYTGIPCGTCGGLNTLRIGKCLQCAQPPLGCGANGECG